MGSGSGGAYSGTNGGSQPYASTYHVIGKEISKDKADPDIYDPKSGYFKNPTATTLDQATDGNRFLLQGKRAEGKFTYVMDKDGNIVFGKRSNPNDARKRAPHPTLIGGKDPQVQCAGMIVFKKGRIVSIDNQSGHYRPNAKSLEKVNSILQKLCDSNPNLFDKDSVWRKKQ